MVGAGAAGLAAAAELARTGRRVLVLEARERVGGRCFTRAMPGLAAPVELGAEFIHGRPQATLARLRAAGIRTRESGHEQRLRRGARLERVDAFAAARAAARDASALEASDLSFAAFLRRRRLPLRTRELARMMVEGFDAAEPGRASARVIVAEWGGSAALSAPQPRPVGGYGPLMEWLARRALEAGARLRLGAAVRELRWRRGGVEVAGEFLGAPFRARAARAIVTLPLGVLQAGTVRFAPALVEKREALAGLAAGPVIRVALRFREAFWARRAPGVAFFHAPRAPFPTFWTPLPMRVPLLTCWAGGPKAARLSGRSERELVHAALASVGSIFNENLESHLDAAIVQDWQADPYARGGYSYVTLGGEGAREALAAPVADTLFFAGEATDTAGEAGTVAGALQSGERAALEAAHLG